MSTEKNITRSIMTWLKTIPGSKWEKRHGGYYSAAGQPDISGCVNGRRIEFEVKVPRTGRATPLQKHELELWHAAGAITGIITSKNDAEEILRTAKII